MKMDVWSRMLVDLDDDERLIWPRMYFQNRQLYAEVCDVVYIVRSRKYPENGITLAEGGAPKRYHKSDDLEMVAKMFVVRLRLPWGDLNHEWMIDQEELHAHREDFNIIEVFLRVRKKHDHTKVILVEPLEFESNRDKYEVLEVRYLVAWKTSLEKTAHQLDIDPNTIHTWMQQ